MSLQSILNPFEIGMKSIHNKFKIAMNPLEIEFNNRCFVSKLFRDLFEAIRSYWELA